jgi:hypothetical protein
MRLGGSAWTAIALAVAGAGLVGCSGAEAPLGGPYGGIATTEPPPSSGNSGGANTTDGTSASGDNGSSSGGASTGSSSSGGGSTSSSSSGSSGGKTGGSSGGTSSSGGGTSSSSSGGTSSGGTSSSSSGGASSSSSGGTSSGGTAAPTWTQIFNEYLAGGTEGNCTACHGQMSSPRNSYSWLESKGYLGGSSPALTDPNQSPLSWYGGNMPPNGPSDPKAVADMNAWASAGAQDN